MVSKKTRAELVGLLDEAMRPFACRKQAMFGGAGYFVNDNIFAGVHGDNVVVRLSDADRASLFSSCREASPFEPMPGRPMREHVVLPPSVYDDPAALETWLDRAFRYAASLPPKPPKAKKKS